VIAAEPGLLERDAELRELDSAIQRVAEGEGGTIVLEGAAGTGKSALVAAASDRAQAAGLRVLSARGSELEREFGFGALRQLFEGVFADRLARDRERLLKGAARPAARVLMPEAVPGGGVTDGFATLHAIYWLAVNLAADEPLLLAVDDAHWADASSLRALSYIAGRISDSPVALLVSVRTHEPGAPEALLDGLRSAPEALRLAPAALSAEAVTSLVKSRVPSVSAEVCEALHDATAGNPFLLNELLLAVSANGALWHPDPVAAIRESSVVSVGDRVVRRIAHLGPQASALTSAMAVLGPEEPLATACALAGLTADEGGRIAHALRLSEILAQEDPFDFAHPLVRRSIYDALSATERNALHASAAELLREAGGSVEEVAAQLGSLPPRGSSATAGALVAAASQASARAAPDEAIRWFERALEEEAAEPPRGAILEGLGLTRAALRDTAAIPNLQEALQLAEEPALRLRVAATLAEVLASAGQWEGALAVVAATHDDLRQADPESEAELQAVRAATMVYDPELVAELDREREHLEEVTTRPGWASHALAAVLSTLAANRGESVEAVQRLADRALEGGRLFAERGAGSWASIQVLGALVEIEECERVLAECDRLTEAARAQGSVHGQLTSLGIRGWLHIRRGDLAAGEAELRSAFDMADTAEMPMAATTGVFFLQDAMLERGGHEDLAALLETLELPPDFARTWSGANLLLVRGRLRMAALDRERGIEDLRAAHEIQAALHWGPRIAPSRSLLALALPASEREEAVRLAAEELELARAAGLPRGEGVALRALGMLTGGEEGIDLLRESASLLADSSAPLEHARSLVDLGAALRRSQRKRDARVELTAGMELANRCGAQRLLDRAHEELKAAGGRPRRIATTGAAALTPSERRVVDLAARGATNPDIAQELFVSEKTVETHLSHAYAKLDIAGVGARERLAEALGEQG
jgi:DNA-binding NarL/FixJ family response regulator